MCNCSKRLQKLPITKITKITNENNKKYTEIGEVALCN